MKFTAKDRKIIQLAIDYLLGNVSVVEIDRKRKSEAKKILEKLYL